MSNSGALTNAVYFDATDADIPASSADSATLLAATAKEVSSIFLSSNVAAPFYLTLGPAGSEEDWLLVPGYASTHIEIDQMAIQASKGVRIGIRAYADSAISAGTVTVNLWG